MSAPTCEFIIAWPTGSKPAVYCGTVATQRYPAMGGGFMHMCDEHSITHLNHTEPIPMDSPEPILQFFSFSSSLTRICLSTWLRSRSHSAISPRRS
jgi:hypothetical protein